MSKIEAGRMKLDMEPLDISKTLAESPARGGGSRPRQAAW